MIMIVMVKGWSKRMSAVVMRRKRRKRRTSVGRMVIIVTRMAKIEVL